MWGELAFTIYKIYCVLYISAYGARRGTCVHADAIALEPYPPAAAAHEVAGSTSPRPRSESISNPAPLKFKHTCVSSGKAISLLRDAAYNVTKAIYVNRIACCSTTGVARGESSRKQDLETIECG